MRIRLLLIALVLLPVWSVRAQGTPDSAYMEACTTPETDLAAAAEAFGVSLEAMEYTNRAREDYREDYLIRPGCFFSTQLNLRPLYAESMQAYPFVLQVIEYDQTFSQLSPEGYFLSQEGYGSYILYDFSMDTDAEGRWVWAGMALLTGLAPFAGHAVAYNGGGFDIRLEHDWIGQTFLHTFLVPQGPIVSVRGGYLDGAEPIIESLEAYDYDSGETLWRLPLEADPRAVFAAPGQTVALVQADGVSGLDATTGEVLWSLPGEDMRAVATGEEPARPPAAEALLIVAGEETLRGVDPLTGEASWTVETPGRAYTHLAYAGGVIVAAGADGDLAAYGVEDGSLLWESAGASDLTTLALACDPDHDCWRLAGGPERVALEQFALADGSPLADYTLPGETVDSELILQVEPTGWVFVSGQHLHARTPTLAH